jgi:7-cyano-7-deazaguanine synthase
MKKAVILLSGGLESAVALAIALKEEREVFPLFVDYEQPNLKQEQKAVWTLVHKLDVRSPHIVNIRGIITGYEPPECYVPGRNTFLLSLAASYAEAQACEEIWIGVQTSNIVRVIGRKKGAWTLKKPRRFPDCDEEYLWNMERALRKGSLALKDLLVRAPLMGMSKTAVVRKGRELGVPMEGTWSCYFKGQKPCGECFACRERTIALQQEILTDDKASDLGIIDGDASTPLAESMQGETT